MLLGVVAKETNEKHSIVFLPRFTKLFKWITFEEILNVPLFHAFHRFWEVELYTELHWKYNVTIYCLRPADLRNNNLYVTLYVHWMYFFVCYLFPFLALVIFNGAIYRRVSKITFFL